MMLIAEAFAEAGDRVDLVLMKDGGALTELMPPSLNRVCFDARTKVGALPALVRYLRTARPEALVSSMAVINCLAVVAHRLARSKARLSLVEHSTLSRETAQHWTRRVLPPTMARLYPMADAVIAVSRGVADDLAREIAYPRERIEVILNAAVTPALMERAKAPAEHPWFNDGGPPVVLGVGRLVYQKAFDVLLRAFAEVRRTRPCRLVILGEGRDRPELEQLAAELGVAEDVSLPGFVIDPMPYFARADVFALSSRFEGLAMVIIEALASGVPIVSTDCESGPREVLGGGRYGDLVPLEDPPALAAAISVVLDGHRAEPADLTPYHVTTAHAHYERVIFPA